MSDADVALRLGGYVWTGWRSISITRSVEALAGGFSVSVSEREAASPVARLLRIGEAVEVLIGEDPVLTGFVDELAIEYGPSNHSVQVGGRDATGDLVDCSAIHEPGEWQDRTLEQIAADLLKPFAAISLVPGLDTGAPFKSFKLAAGESVFAALDRGARMRGLLPTSNGQGGLCFTRPGQFRAPTRLRRQDGLILEASLEASDKERFSRYVVHGQTASKEGWGGQEEGSSLRAEASDSGIGRYRPLAIQAEASAELADLRTRAAFEATTRAARSRPVRMVVRGWAVNGWRWQPGAAIAVEDPLIGVSGDMVIGTVGHTLSDGAGRRTELALMRPEAFSTIPLPEQEPGNDLWAPEREQESDDVD